MIKCPLNLRQYRCKLDTAIRCLAYCASLASDRKMTAVFVHFNKDFELLLELLRCLWTGVEDFWWGREHISFYRGDEKEGQGRRGSVASHFSEKDRTRQRTRAWRCFGGGPQPFKCVTSAPRSLHGHTMSLCCQYSLGLRLRFLLTDNTDVRSAVRLAKDRLDLF